MLERLWNELGTMQLFTSIYHDEPSPEFKTPVSFTQKNKGKEQFWVTWNKMLAEAKQSSSELFIFLQDDVINVDFDRILKYHNQLKGNPYAFQLINDGRVNCWNAFRPKWVSSEIQEIGFVDCLMFCNRDALHRLRWAINDVAPKLRHQMISSGVGYKLSKKFMHKNIKMYRPFKSLVYHGDHDSVMHYEHRKQNPLISK